MQQAHACAAKSSEQGGMKSEAKAEGLCFMVTGEVGIGEALRALTKVSARTGILFKLSMPQLVEPDETEKELEEDVSVHSFST